MKQWLFGCVIFLVAVALGFADGELFSRSVSPEDFNAAGLGQLSPLQLKRLDELVGAYRASVVTAARRTADEALQAKRATETEAKAAQVEAAESKNSSQGFLPKAKVMLVPGTPVEYAMIKTTIRGKFEGWESQTVFTLANGQRWQVANPGEHYFTPAKDDIVVQITPARLGGYWMFFPLLEKQVRVKLIDK
jgi:hypothetical protein